MTDCLRGSTPVDSTKECPIRGATAAWPATNARLVAVLEALGGWCTEAGKLLGELLEGTAVQSLV